MLEIEFKPNKNFFMELMAYILKYCYCCVEKSDYNWLLNHKKFLKGKSNISIEIQMYLYKYMTSSHD